jgi:hypothetical protein
MPGEGTLSSGNMNPIVEEEKTFAMKELKEEIESLKKSLAE